MSLKGLIGKKFSYGLVALVLAAGIILPSIAVQALGEAFSGGSDVSGNIGEAIAVDDLSITGTGDDEITVSLFVPEGVLEFGTITGLVFEGNTSGNSLQFTGTRSNINAALATLTYILSQPGSYTIEATIVSGDGGVYNPDTGRVYQVVAAPGSTWDQAKAAAESLTYSGASGYLATITSQEENDFILSRLSQNGWIAASDAGTEGDWQWVAGPESGTSFWAGDFGGLAVANRYANWNWNEPNDSGGDEDCAEFRGTDAGEWNDYPCSTTQVDYYVAEFGDGNINPTVATSQIVATVSVPTINVSNCEELESVDDEVGSEYETITLQNDIDCNGQTIDPLFSNNSYRGVFDGNNHTISNFVLDQEDHGVALIAGAQDATIRNLKLLNVQATGESEVAALIGSTNDSLTIQNVHIRNATISSTYGGDVGALVGDLQIDDTETGIIENVSATGSVTSSGEYSSNIGGLIGMAEARNSSLTIRKAYADVAVTNVAEFEEGSFNDIGGLFGELEADNDYGDDDANVLVQDVYAWGDVTAVGSENVGGLVGRVDAELDVTEPHASVTIQRAYAKGAVLGALDVGGLIGQFDSVNEDPIIPTYIVESSFAMGEVTKLEDVLDSSEGGLIGMLDDNAVDYLASDRNYFDQSRSNQSSCNADIAIGGCTAVNTTGQDRGYFINNITNAPLNDWNFNNVWVANRTVPPTFTGVVTQDDEDGASTEVEDAAPNGGDANNDGIPDSEQANVTSFVNTLTGKYMVLETTCDNNDSVRLETESDNGKDAAYSYPAGLIGFVGRDCGAPGSTAAVKLYYYGSYASSDFVLRKTFGEGIYSTITGASLSNTTIGGQSVLSATYQIVDGGELDLDGQADGNIADPAGLALPVAGVPNTGLGGALGRR